MVDAVLYAMILHVVSTSRCPIMSLSITLPWRLVHGNCSRIYWAGYRWTLPRWFSPVISPQWSPPELSPVISPRWSPPDLESLLERMKRLDFSKPVTRRLIPGSSDYANPNANPTRPSRHVTWTEGDHRGGNYRGESSGGDLRGKLPGGNHQGSSPRPDVCIHKLLM